MEDNRFHKQLSPLNAWAFSFACIIGWAAFVMPATVFLPQGGILGSVLAFSLGAVLMGVVALNYHYLTQDCPVQGDIYSLVKTVLPQEHAFAAGWAIILSHLCCIPLNARALANFTRLFLEEVFDIRFHVRSSLSNSLLVELIIMILALVVIGLLNIQGIRVTGIFQTFLALVLLGGFVCIFIGACFSGEKAEGVLTPALYPGKSGFSSFLSIFSLVPWAFVGFDSLPMLSQEIRFSKKKIGSIMIVAVLAGTFIYIGGIFIALLGMPTAYDSWPEYVDHFSGIQGINSVPVISAAGRLMGRWGITIALYSAGAAILTGLIGFFASVSRQLYGMAKDDMLFAWLAKLHPKNGVPVNAVYFIVTVAIAINLMGNGITTIEEMASACTSFGYGYCSLSAFLKARKEKNTFFRIVGGVGTIACLFWMLLLFFPINGIDAAISTKGVVFLGIWIFIGIWGYAYSCMKKGQG